MQDYNDKQDFLKSQATQILKELDLIKFLSKFGKVELVGSYYLDLMTWRDIDIEVYGEPGYPNFLETTTYLFNKEKVYSLALQDYRKSVFSDRPQGIYLGVRYLFDRTKGWSEMWKIDVWFLPKDQTQALEQRNYVKAKLTPEVRNIILTIKNEMRDNTTQGKKVSGSDVYQAVIDHGIKDLEGFREYLRQQGREL